ncbi:GNAT family N-acetyltransferase [Bacteroides ihuae]|uniref:GNAT family N-acetyltransferase n=1 Tax=Bacteroides ihuae TaxID=1852362 RepID=UPI0008D9FA56|nr:GNAT family N-acetyltransferase [Bacteroides ihuae]
MENEYKLNTTPLKSELAIVKQWLYDEYLKLNCQSGFYCNWEIIEKGFSQNKVFIYLLKNNPVGFALWCEHEGCVNMQILAVSPSMRHLGIGKAFVEMLCDFFRMNETFAIKCYCSPKESVSFWEGKMRFIQYPNIKYSKSELTFYKPLIHTTPFAAKPNPINKLELWDDEPHMTNHKAPKWCWNINVNLQSNPIIHPCNSNWNLRLTRNGEIVKDDKIKYFTNRIKSIEKDDFLYIDSLL